MTGRWFLDSSVLVLAAGGEHVLRAPSRALVGAAHSGDVQVHVSVEAIQELVYHRMRRGDRAAALAESRSIQQSCVLHAFDDEVLDRALHLIEISPVRGRDAVHAATALIAGFSEIVTADADFDAVPGLHAISPEQALSN